VPMSRIIVKVVRCDSIAIYEVGYFKHREILVSDMYQTSILYGYSQILFHKVS